MHASLKPEHEAMEFEKLTTRYDEYQDRICVDGQTGHGEVVTLWLTHRLLQRLMPLLLGIITPLPGSALDVEAMAAWELNRSRAKQKPQKAVERPALQAPPGGGEPVTSPAPPIWLVESVNLNGSPTQTCMVFRTGTGEVASVSFSAEQLRQWVAIVYGQWQIAGWSPAMWPDWLKEAAEKPGQGTGTLVH